MSVRQIAIPTGSHESKRNAPKTRAQRRALSSQAARQTNHLHLPDTEHDTVAPMSIRVPTTSLSFVLPVDPLDLFSLINTHCPWPNFTSGTGREAWRYSTAVTDSLCPEYDASVDTLTRDQRKHLHLSRV